MMNTLDNAIQELINGGIVALPTETVYGLAVDMKNHQAITKLYNLKGRPANKPTAIAISDPGSLDSLVETIPAQARKLIEAFWPGPLTLVFPCSANVPHAITSQHASVGIRCSSSLIILRIIAALGNPICLTSANLAGQKEALTAKEVLQYFPTGIFVLEDDDLIKGVPSTIIDFSVTPYKLLREGAIPFAAIQKLLDIS